MTPQEILQIVSWTIAAFGVIVIIVASFVAFALLARTYLDRRIDELHRRLEIIRVREGFTGRIIFGLDFLIASDIVLSVLVPNIDEIARLGGIVVIRVVLTYIISKETQELERRQQWEEEHEHEAASRA